MERLHAVQPLQDTLQSRRPRGSSLYLSSATVAGTITTLLLHRFTKDAPAAADGSAEGSADAG